MRKINFSTIDNDRSFDIPWDWLGGSEVKFVINDLEAKKRSVVSLREFCIVLDKQKFRVLP